MSCKFSPTAGPNGGKATTRENMWYVRVRKTSIPKARLK